MRHEVMILYYYHPTRKSASGLTTGTCARASSLSILSLGFLGWNPPLGPRFVWQNVTYHHASWVRSIKKGLGQEAPIIGASESWTVTTRAAGLGAPRSARKLRCEPACGPVSRPGTHPAPPPAMTIILSLPRLREYCWQKHDIVL